MNDIMKAVPNGRRQSASQTQMNSKVIEGLYLLKKELKQQKSIGEQNFGSYFQGKTSHMEYRSYESQCTNSVVQE